MRKQGRKMTVIGTCTKGVTYQARGVANAAPEIVLLDSLSREK